MREEEASRPRLSPIASAPERVGSEAPAARWHALCFPNGTGEPATLKIHKILVPVDFSKHSQRALDEAIGLAKTFDAELHLLHCYQLYPAGAPYDVVLPESYERAIQESVRGRLSEWRQRASAQGVRVQEHISASAPANGVVDLAETLGADLIVMGTRGLTGLKHVLLGSVAERTIRTAPCPVLTVKHAAD
jgi:nucleotide-binding universal stress UspA family protein